MWRRGGAAVRHMAAEKPLGGMYSALAWLTVSGLFGSSRALASMAGLRRGPPRGGAGGGYLDAGCAAWLR